MTTPNPSQPMIGVIACGAIARELLAVAEQNGWSMLKLHCLPADLHNRPQLIPDQVREKILSLRDRYDQLFVAYADCGTGGLLDKVLDEFDIPRLSGAHCYEFFSGTHSFDKMMDAEPGTLFLTDFLVRHFQRLMIKGLGLDRYPQLRDSYFGHYRKLIYIAQEDDEALQLQARECAAQLGLEYDYRFTGFQNLKQSMLTAETIQWQN